VSAASQGAAGHRAREKSLEHARGEAALAPGAALLSWTALASALLILINDYWLKRQHPGVLSGKLSDVGLCLFLPLFVCAAFEWSAVAWGALSGQRSFSASGRGRLVLHVAACAVATAYFVAVKVWPVATAAHVAWLSALFPSRSFAAVTDPSDLVCLPFVVVAWRTMRARGAPGQLRRPRRS
jgi:hypothetical protein